MVQQRSPQFKSGVVASNGTVTITFDPPPLGMVFTGTVTITNAPSGTVWQVLNSGQVIDIIASTNSAGNIQAHRNEVISLTGSGLQPGIRINATYWALAEDETTADFVMPQHDSNNPLTGYSKLIFAGQIASSGAPVALPNNPYTILPTTRSLIVVVYSPQNTAGAAAFVNITGLTSGINWAAFATPGLQVIAGTGPAYALPMAIAIPCYGVVDNQLNISVTSLNAASPIGVAIAETPDEITLGNPQEPQAIVDPLGAFFGTRQTIANGGAAGTLVPAPPVGFMTEVKEASVWQQGAATATAQNVIFDSATSTSFAGGFFQTGLVGISHVTFVNMFTLNAINFTGNASGVTVVYDIFTRNIPIIQAIP